jgi:signal transduction histidine kinase
VTDDGRGFDLTARRTGFGLLGLRERAALVGGECTVDSRPGAGTSVTVTVP